MQITVCPNCQTSLYITDEQLRQAQGKVKCGRCLTIFNAMDHLKSAQEQNVSEFFGAEFSEEDKFAVLNENEDENTQPERLENEDEFNFSFSLPSGSGTSSALAGVSVRETMRVATDSVYSPREQPSIFSSEEITLEDSDELLDRESLLSDFVLALEDGEEEVLEETVPEQQQSDDGFLSEEAVLSEQGGKASYVLAQANLTERSQDVSTDISFEEEKVIRVSQQQNIFTPSVPVDSSKTERMLFTGIVAALCCLVVQIIGSFFITVPTSYPRALEVSALTSNVSLQGNRLFLSVKASQPMEKIKGKTMYLSLMGADGKVVVLKAIPAERYLPFAKNKDGHMMLDMTLFTRQPINSFSNQIQWLP